MYTKGLEINVQNLDKVIETFGINFSKEVFLHIAQRGNDLLKSFADRILTGTEVILSDDWRTSTPKMNLIIKEMLSAPHQGPLQELYLYSKSIELLVLQAEQYAAPDDTILISTADRSSLIAAKDILNKRLDNPPTLFQLSKLVGLSEYKLKTGFKKLFGLTAYGYLNSLRMEQAKNQLLDTDKAVKEIAYDLGFSSPQHFSKAFKKEYKVSPNSIRSLPNKTTPKL